MMNRMNKFLQLLLSASMLLLFMSSSCHASFFVSPSHFSRGAGIAIRTKKSHKMSTHSNNDNDSNSNSNNDNIDDNYSFLQDLQKAKIQKLGADIPTPPALQQSIQNSQNEFLNAMKQVKSDFNKIKDEIGVDAAIDLFKRDWDEEDRLWEEEMEKGWVEMEEEKEKEEVDFFSWFRYDDDEEEEEIFLDDDVDTRSNQEGIDFDFTDNTNAFQ